MKLNNRKPSRQGRLPFAILKKFRKNNLLFGLYRRKKPWYNNKTSFIQGEEE